MKDKEPQQPSKHVTEVIGGCQYCGAPTSERIDGNYVCLQCYIDRGSCCQEQDC